MSVLEFLDGRGRPWFWSWLAFEGCCEIREERWVVKAREEEEGVGSVD